MTAVFSFFLKVCTTHGIIGAAPKGGTVVSKVLALPVMLPPAITNFFLLLVFDEEEPFKVFLFRGFKVGMMRA